MDSNIMKISFIIIEYYSIDDVLNCISSIEKLDLRFDYEVIVSSNSVYASEKRMKLESRWSSFKWCFNEKNGGFAYAMNQGLKIAEGNVLVIMNPDVRIEKGIDEMVNYLLSNPAVGIIAPQVKNKKGATQDSFREFITPFNFVTRHINRLIKCEKKIIVKSPCIVDWVIGAFMMMSRQTYELIGGLDDNYFLYCEDMDLCKRIWLKGYSVVYYPAAIIEYEGTRSARARLKYSCIFLKSLIRYWRQFGIWN